MRRAATPSGSPRSTAKAAPSATSRASISISAPASCCRKPASSGRTAASPSRWTARVRAPSGRALCRFTRSVPAIAEFDDGRTMVYGAMGGDGQPQTQAAIFSRYAMFGQELQAAVTAPRWLLGRRWANEGATLKLERPLRPGAGGAIARAPGTRSSWSSRSAISWAMPARSSGTPSGAAGRRRRSAQRRGGLRMVTLRSQTVEPGNWLPRRRAPWQLRFKREEDNEMTESAA